MRTRLVLLLLAALMANAILGCRAGTSKLWPNPNEDPGRDPKPTDLSD